MYISFDQGDQMEVSLRRAEFYKRIFDEILRLSDDGFIVVDNHAIVTDINELYSKFLGKPREEIIGKPITNVIPNSIHRSLCQ